MNGPALTLRDYQVEAVEAALGADAQRSAIVMPTGGGKTAVIAGVVRRHFEQARGRSLVIAHRIELIEQNARTIRRFAPDLRVGIVKAERDQTGHDVISASVQTLVSAARRGRIRDVGLVVIDEAHHAVSDSYMRVLGHYGCFTDGGARALGLTATLERGDDKALGDVWQDVVYSKSIAWMIEHGWLVRPRGLRVRVPDLDLRKVRKTRGDFSDSSLGEAIEGSLAPELVAKAYAEHASGKQGILFAPTVHTAELYRDALCEVGITAELVHGAMAEGDRRRTLRRFEDGAIQVLCNCMVLTEGTDLPMAEVCVIGRPTLNRGLLIQMAGRVLRLHPGKDSALIIDVSGATERHSLLGAIELFGEESVHVPVEGEAPESEQPDDLDSADLDLGRTVLDEDLDGGPTWLTGPTEVVEVDLFHGSKSMWQRTQGGIWFINATSGKDSSRYIIVQRAVRPGAWDVIEMDAKVRGRSSWVATDVDDLSFAMAFAEANVTDGERVTARKNARWRKDRPSDAQAELAVRMGIRGSVAEVMMMMTKGEVAAALDHRFASRRIDPYVPAHARRAA
jgi:superfamily II DNA or RNA helicase